MLVRHGESVGKVEIFKSQLAAQVPVHSDYRIVCCEMWRRVLLVRYGESVGLVEILKSEHATQVPVRGDYRTDLFEKLLRRVSLVRHSKNVGLIRFLEKSACHLIVYRKWL